MTDRELAALLGADTPPPPEDPAHRARLEGELMAAFDRKAGSARRPSREWMRYATAAACVLCLVTATQVPAGYEVEVGRRVSLALPEGSSPAPEQLAEQVARALRTRDAKVVDVSVRRSFAKEHEGPQQLRVDVWGHGLAPDAEVLARLQALPGLQDVPVRLERLEGRVHDTLLGALRHQLFRADATPEAREAARQRLVQELRRLEGPEAEVDVEVDQATGKQRVRVKVKRSPRE